MLVTSVRCIGLQLKLLWMGGHPPTDHQDPGPLRRTRMCPQRQHAVSSQCCSAPQPQESRTSKQSSFTLPADQLEAGRRVRKGIARSRPSVTVSVRGDISSVIVHVPHEVEPVPATVRSSRNASAVPPRLRTSTSACPASSDGSPRFPGPAPPRPQRCAAVRPGRPPREAGLTAPVSRACPSAAGTETPPRTAERVQLRQRKRAEISNTVTFFCSSALRALASVRKVAFSHRSRRTDVNR